MPLVAQGEFALVREQMERALHTSGQPVRRGTIAHDHDIYLSLTDTAVRLRDEQSIRSYAPLLDELAKRDGHRIFEAIAQRAWGVAHRLAGDYTQSAECFDRAVSLLDTGDVLVTGPSDGQVAGSMLNDQSVDRNDLPEHTNGMPAHQWQIARTFVEMAELAVALSNLGRAREYYERALQAFDALGAVPDMQTTREALERLG